MGLDRFYCPKIDGGAVILLDGDEARHLAKVRRVPVGAEVEVFDGRGRSVRAEVVELGRDRATLRVRERLATRPGPAARFTLATAIPKGDRFDWLIEKATELGVERVVPLITERSTVDPRAAKLDRLRRVVVEASKQCRRDSLMTLDDPQPWGRWVEQVGGSIPHRWLAHPGGSTAWRAEPPGADAPVVAAIGPEGGFTDREVDAARSAGWQIIDLTATILRVETAGLAVAAHCLLRTAAPGA